MLKAFNFNISIQINYISLKYIFHHKIKNVYILSHPNF